MARIRDVEKNVKEMYDSFVLEEGNKTMKSVSNQKGKERAIYEFSRKLIVSMFNGNNRFKDYFNGISDENLSASEINAKIDQEIKSGKWMRADEEGTLHITLYDDNQGNYLDVEFTKDQIDTLFDEKREPGKDISLNDKINKSTALYEMVKTVLEKGQEFYEREDLSNFSYATNDKTNVNAYDHTKELVLENSRILNQGESISDAIKRDAQKFSIVYSSALVAKVSRDPSIQEIMLNRATTDHALVMAEEREAIARASEDKEVRFVNVGNRKVAVTNLDLMVAQNPGLIQEYRALEVAYNNDGSKKDLVDIINYENSIPEENKGLYADAINKSMIDLVTNGITKEDLADAIQILGIDTVTNRLKALEDWQKNVVENAAIDYVNKNKEQIMSEEVPQEVKDSYEQIVNEEKNSNKNMEITINIIDNRQKEIDDMEEQPLENYDPEDPTSPEIYIETLNEMFKERLEEFKSASDEKINDLIERQKEFKSDMKDIISELAKRESTVININQQPEKDNTKKDDTYIQVEDGKDGKNGKDGYDGKDGHDGDKGIDGENGRDGDNGNDGEDGSNGKDGKDGKTIINDRPQNNTTIIERVIENPEKPEDKDIDDDNEKDIEDIEEPEEEIDEPEELAEDTEEPQEEKNVEQKERVQDEENDIDDSFEIVSEYVNEDDEMLVLEPEEPVVEPKDIFVEEKQGDNFQLRIEEVPANKEKDVVEEEIKEDNKPLENQINTDEYMKYKEIEDEKRALEEEKQKLENARLEYEEEKRRIEDERKHQEELENIENEKARVREETEKIEQAKNDMLEKEERRKTLEEIDKSYNEYDIDGKGTRSKEFSKEYKRISDENLKNGVSTTTEDILKADEVAVLETLRKQMRSLSSPSDKVTFLSEHPELREYLKKELLNSRQTAKEVVESREKLKEKELEIDKYSVEVEDLRKEVLRKEK